MRKAAYISNTVFVNLVVESTCPENLAYRLGLETGSWLEYMYVTGFDDPEYVQQRRDGLSTFTAYQALFEQLRIRGFDNLEM